MALIECPDCGEGVSDKAKTCPKCGLPVAKHVRDEEKRQRLAKAAEEKHAFEEGKRLAEWHRKLEQQKRSAVQKKAFEEGFVPGCFRLVMFYAVIFLLLAIILSLL